MKHDKHDVYWADLRTGFKENLLGKMARLFCEAGLSGIVGKNDLVAVKFHAGEKGCTAYIRPEFVRVIVDEINKLGGQPFLAETNTLYHGQRKNAVEHLRLAASHGFIESVAGAPLIICDGLAGQNECAVTINQAHIAEAHIAADIVRADALISLAHFKLHLGTGFGGAIKNVGMGCASVAGKLAQHCNVRPAIDGKKCTACGRCLSVCLPQAVHMEEEKVVIDSGLCTGCAECVAICPFDAVRIRWDATTRDLQERMVEYHLAAVQDKKDKVGYMNFLMQISPGCDCMPFSDGPIVPDIGVLASLDPVAIDQASVDLLNRSRGNQHSAVEARAGEGEDKIRAVYPDIDWEIQLEYGERVGLGTRAHRLVSV